MIITKFSLFEKAMNEDFDHIDEGFMESVRNFLSKTLGGRVAKLDRLITKFERNESDYWDKWSAATIDKNEAEAKRYNAGYDSNRQELDDLIERLDKLLREVEEEKSSVNDSLMRQANLIIKENARLRAYFDMNKAKADERVAHDNYERMKTEADKETIADMYTKYKKKSSEFKRFETAFRTNFEDDMGVDSEETRTIPNEVDSVNNNVIRKIGASDIEEISMSMEEFKAMIDGKNRNELDGIYKVIERNVKMMREKRDDEYKRIKGINATGSKIDSPRATREATRFVEAANIVINALEKKAAYVFRTMAMGKEENKVSKDSADTIKQRIIDNPEMVADVTPKEIDVPKTADKAIEKTATRVENPTVRSAERTIDQSVDKFFEAGREQIEDMSGEKMTDKAYDKLQADLVNLFGKLTLFYKKEHNEVKSKTLNYSLLAFASDIYAYKKQHDILNRELSQKELDKKFDEFEQTT